MRTNPGYILPETINPPGRLHICVPVPDEPQHLQAFLGQLDMLAYWWTWKRDPDKQGTEVAKVWRGVVDAVRNFIDNGEDCDLPFDIRVTDCTIEKSTDGGATWVLVADLSACGAVGPQGPKGDKGDVGDVGPDGDIGEQGPQGEAGAQGETGEKGDTGATGPKGDTGDTGPAGPTGPKGDTGDTGPMGEAGPAGEQGPAGVTPPETIPGDDGDNKRCAVATECAEELHRVFQSITEVTTGQRSAVTAGAAGVGTIMAAIFPVAAVAIGVMGAAVGIYNLLLAAEADGYLPYFDGTFTFEMQCNLYCLLDGTGKYTQAIHDAWVAKIRENPDGLHQIVASVLETVGHANFAWAAASAPLLAAPDCGGCDCTPVVSQLVYFQPDNATPQGHFDIQEGDVVDVPFFAARGVAGLVFGWEGGDCCNCTVEMIGWTGAPGYEECHVAYCAGGDTGYPDGPPSTINGASVVLIWSNTTTAIARVTIGTITKG